MNALKLAATPCLAGEQAMMVKRDATDQALSELEREVPVLRVRN